MAMSIMTNVASLGAQRNLSKTQDRLTQSIGRLSSGFRINRAGDDAAGLGISSKMSAHIRGLAQAERNANDGVSMIQTAEGALGEVHGLLSRMRELSVEAANEGTLGNAERGYLDDEFQALKSEIDRISAVTQYNGQNLLDGSVAGMNFQVGIFDSANDRISVTIAQADSTTLGIAANDLTTAANAQTTLTALDTAIDTISSNRGDLGAVQNRLSVTMSNLSTTRENLSAANSRIVDVDVAEESAALARSQILMQAGVSVLAQANQLPQSALGLLGR